MKILDVPRSGSYQGITSSRNRYGQYVRTRATPVNPSTTFQSAVRARLAAASAAWRQLTDEQRTSWSALGLYMTRTDSLGQTVNLTGIQAYVSVNSNNAAAGNAQVSDPPILTTPDALLTAALTVVGGVSMSLAYTPTPLGAGQRAFIFASAPRSAGVTFAQDLRLITVTAAAAASPANIFAAYSARWGAVLAGQKIFVSVQVYDSGFLSAPIMASAIAT